MSLLILNIVFAVVFTMLLGSDSISAFLSGFVLGYAALWLSKPLYRDTRYFKKLPRTINLAGYFLKELAVSNLRVTASKRGDASFSKMGGSSSSFFSTQAVCGLIAPARAATASVPSRSRRHQAYPSAAATESVSGLT